MADALPRPAGRRARVPRAGIVPLVAAIACVSEPVLAMRGGFHGPSDALARGLVPAGLGLALGAAVFFRPLLMPRLTAAILSIAVSVYVAEALLRALTPNGLTPIARAIRARAAGVQYDLRDPLEVVADLRRAGVTAYPAIPPRSILSVGADGALRSPVRVGDRELFPLSGIARVHTVLDNESGRYGEYESDEHGFNNPPGAWAAAPGGVVLVGDSFTQGCGVPPESNLTAIVRARFPGTVGLGASGAGPLTELGELREYGALLRPRVVLWDYFGNDLDDLEVEKRSPLIRYLEPDFRQDLAGAQADIDGALARIVDAKAGEELSVLNRARRFITLSRLRSVAGLGLAAPAPSGGPLDLELFRRVLDQGRREVDAWGGHLVFVFLPSWQHYARRPINERHDEVLEVARSLGLPTIDVRAAFDREPVPLDLFPYRLPGHYNARGYRIAGEALAAWIEASGLLR